MVVGVVGTYQHAHLLFTAQNFKSLLRGEAHVGIPIITNIAEGCGKNALVEHGDGFGSVLVVSE